MVKHPSQQSLGHVGMDRESVDVKGITTLKCHHDLKPNAPICAQYLNMTFGLSFFNDIGQKWQLLWRGFVAVNASQHKNPILI